MRMLWMVAGMLALAGVAIAAPPRKPPAAVAPQSSPAAELAVALAPFLATGPQDSGWIVTGAPVVTEPRPGALAIQFPGLSYLYPVVGGSMVANFGAVEADAAREGEGWRLTMRPSGWITVSDGAGEAVRASVDIQTLTGLWLPEREAFKMLDIRLHDLRVRFRNGDTFNFAQVLGRFETVAAAMKGNVAVVGFGASSASGAPLGRAETANLALALDGMDGPAAALKLGWEHARRQDMDGVPAELTPLRLQLSGTLAPFPWREMLHQLPTAAMDLAGAPDEKAGLLRSVWDRLRPVLHRAETRAREVVVRANSANLAANGQGEAFFPAAAGQTGRLVVDVRGINERIAGLTRQDRQKHPMLFPSLALMTVLAEGLTEGGRRIHRYNVELVESGLKLNGADVSSIKPPKP